MAQLLKTNKIIKFTFHLIKAVRQRHSTTAWIIDFPYCSHRPILLLPQLQAKAVSVFHSDSLSRRPILSIARRRLSGTSRRCRIAPPPLETVPMEKCWWRLRSSRTRWLCSARVAITSERVSLSWSTRTEAKRYKFSFTCIDVTLQLLYCNHVVVWIQYLNCLYFNAVRIR